jgi:hypothetical protein
VSNPVPSFFPLLTFFSREFSYSLTHKSSGGPFPYRMASALAVVPISSDIRKENEGGEGSSKSSQDSHDTESSEEQLADNRRRDTNSYIIEWLQGSPYLSEKSESESEYREDGAFLNLHILRTPEKSRHRSLSLFCLDIGDGLFDLMESALHQRRAWGIFQPIVGIRLDQLGISATTVIAWLNPDDDAQMVNTFTLSRLHNAKKSLLGSLPLNSSPFRTRSDCRILQIPSFFLGS